MIYRRVIFLSLFLAQVCFAQMPATQTAIGQGKAVIRNITPEQAGQQAFDRARKSAVRNALGVTIQAESLVKDAMAVGEFILGTDYGHIVKEDTLIDTIMVEKIRGEMVMVRHVKLQVEVAPEQGERDYSFVLALELNKNTFASGEELWMKLRATRDCYLTILNIDANDDIYVMFPNRYLPDNFLPANNMKEIPGPEDRSMGIRYRVSLLPHHTDDKEIIIAIATKKPHAFLEGAEVSEVGGFKKFKNDKFALTELAAWLASIPANERAVASQIYYIAAK